MVQLPYEGRKNNVNNPMVTNLKLYGEKFDMVKKFGVKPCVNTVWSRTNGAGRSWHPRGGVVNTTKKVAQSNSKPLV